MGKTKIEWADYTLNPITGCSLVSVGCWNCYAQKMAIRLAGRCGYDKEHPFGVTYHPDKMNLKGIKPGSIVFLNSMGDMFHQDVQIEWIDAILDKLIYPAYRMEPRIHFVVLTKRPENIMWKLYEQDDENIILENGNISCSKYRMRYFGSGDYLPNLHIGISCENQEMFDKRMKIYTSLNCPMCDGIVSFEPLLSEIDIKPYKNKIKWALVGGETGQNARYCNYDWIGNIWTQCTFLKKIPFFFKQWGKNSGYYDDYYKQPISKLFELIENTREYPAWKTK